MVYPLLPLFLTRVLGAGAMSLGVIEGVAEAANSILKVVSGWMTDRWRRPKRLVLAGYGLSSAVRPLTALVNGWPQVLSLRFADRVGKGIRTAPRDAVLAGYAPAHLRGRVYGFHRAMDHAGAVAGPLLASLFLFLYPGEYRTLFALTILPGIVVVLLVLRLPPDRGDRSASPEPLEPREPPEPREPLEPREAVLTRRFTSAMFVIFVFTLGNASDAFLLLRLSDLGVTPLSIPLLWSALHVVKVVTSVAGGTLSDRMGRRKLIAMGWIVYALVYGGFGFFDAPVMVIVLFLLYGSYFGLTEGVEKAWVADMAPVERRGTAFGIYNAVLGIGSLGASLMFGWIWTRVSPPAAFCTGAALAIAATLLLYFMFPDAKDSRHQR
jgi:MFS family permease